MIPWFMTQYEIFFGLDRLGNSDRSIKVSMCAVYEHVCEGVSVHVQWPEDSAGGFQYHFSCYSFVGSY